ncbi:MAG: hypothetical protein PHY68_06380, partial [Proteiniphilum sp.]|nr:hypothetical protein [Proteiniphilum sp.]
MKKTIIGLLLLTTLLAGCDTQKREVTLTVQNSGSVDRENQMVEIPWNNIAEKLGTAVEKSLI